MDKMTQSNLDLAGIFQTVTQALTNNQQSLNQADEYNQNHGDNMVQTFQTITQALEQKKNSPESTALAYAAKQLSQSTTSTSGQQYAKNLADASKQFKGQQLNAQTAMSLLQMLIGGGQSTGSGSAGSGDALSSLLGSVMGGEAPSEVTSQSGADLLGSLLGGATGSSQGATQAPSASGANLLGSLLGGLTGESGTSQQSTQGGGDILSDLLGGVTGGGQPAAAGGSQNQGGFGLLNAGLAFLQAKQTGQGNTQALLQAFMAGSGMGNSAHRTQSTQLVVNSFLQALGSMSQK
jgi:hypothetical protein